MEKVKIELYVQGGIIQDITGPDGTPRQSFVEVKVFDYDVEAYPEEQLSKDRDGEKCRVILWR